MEVQQALVVQLNQEIEKVKGIQLAGYGRGGSTEQKVQLNLGALAALDAADLSNNGELGQFLQLRPCLSMKQSYFSCKSEGSNSNAWTPGTTGTALTGSQQVQLQQIRDRDAEFDQDLDQLGEVSY